eukprot:Hpha_TRINITY_DN13145_c0_g1::TRINITY_DN13145_c0_g1_i2::g.113856::m.113856
MQSGLSHPVRDPFDNDAQLRRCALLSDDGAVVLHSRRSSTQTGNKGKAGRKSRSPTEVRRAWQGGQQGAADELGRANSARLLHRKRSAGGGGRLGIRQNDGSDEEVLLPSTVNGSDTAWPECKLEPAPVMPAPPPPRGQSLRESPENPEYSSLDVTSSVMFTVCSPSASALDFLPSPSILSSAMELHSDAGASTEGAAIFLVVSMAAAVAVDAQRDWKHNRKSAAVAAATTGALAAVSSVCEAARAQRDLNRKAVIVAAGTSGLVAAVTSACETALAQRELNRKAAAAATAGAVAAVSSVCEAARAQHDLNRKAAAVAAATVGAVAAVSSVCEAVRTQRDLNRKAAAAAAATVGAVAAVSSVCEAARAQHDLNRKAAAVAAATVGAAAAVSSVCEAARAQRD